MSFPEGATRQNLFQLSYAVNVLKFSGSRAPFAVISAHPILREAAEMCTTRPIVGRKATPDEDNPPPVEVNPLSDPNYLCKGYDKLNCWAEEPIGVRLGNTVTFLTYSPREECLVRCMLVLDESSLRKKATPLPTTAGTVEPAEEPLFEDWEEALLYEETLERGGGALAVRPPPIGWWTARQTQRPLPFIVHVSGATSPVLTWLERTWGDSLTALYLCRWIGTTLSFTSQLPTLRLPITGLHSASTGDGIIGALGDSFAGQFVEHLDLPFYKGSAAEIGIALSRLPRLKRCNLSFFTYPVSPLGDCLSGTEPSWSSLEELTLMRVLLDHTFLSYLSFLPHLYRLDLSGTTVDSASLSCLRSPTLQVLKLLGCARVTDLSWLSGLTALRQLELCKTHITSDSLYALFALPYLTELNLSACAMLRNVDAVWALRSLQTLNLSQSHPSNGEASARLIPAWWPARLTMEGYAPQGQLKTLILEQSVLDGASLAFLAEHCCNVETIRAPFSSFLRRVGVLGSAHHLTHLSLRGSAITENGLKGLDNNHTLRSIDISGCGQVRDITPLARIPFLHTLLANKTSITDAALARFSEEWCRFHLNEEGNLVYRPSNAPGSEAVGLSTISLQLCSSLRSVGCLGKVRTLKELSLSSNFIFDTSFAVFVDLPCQLLRPLSKRTSCLMETVEERRMELASLLFSASSLTVGRQWRCTTYLNLYDCTAVRYIAPLGLLTELVTLDLGRTSVDSASLTEYVQVLLSCVDLQCNRDRPMAWNHAQSNTIEEEGQIADGAPFTKGLKLQNLHLALCTYITDFTVLAYVSSLLYVDLSRTRVEDTFVKRYGLACNETGAACIQELDLTYCAFLESVEGLLYCSSLRTVSLRGSPAATHLDEWLLEEFLVNGCTVSV
ncbi:hypothetical protein ADEAN_000021400 [Angomonas deanei]|uniref:Leucine Rich repeat n=1 Tax=Angomonas deanei TaxID=59799 RepID=A0A7G2C4I5_9TRYP|nr:hypothetical protein ADEAN_000021400 [Angomonas deanei]